MSYEPLHADAEQQIANSMDWATLRETDVLRRDTVLGLMRWAMRWAYADAARIAKRQDDLAEYGCLEALAIVEAIEARAK